MKELFCGIDIGTTAVKAALFDRDGNCAGHGGCEYTLETPHPGVVELDPQIYLDSVRRACLEAFAAAGAGVKICSVAITGQVETFICVDASGRPLRKTIVWLDSRAVDEAKELEEHFTLERLCQISGQTAMLPCWTASKLLYLQKHEPEVLRRTAKILMVEDFILHALTGKFITGRGLLPSSLYYDMNTGNYFQEMLDYLSLDHSSFPELHDSGEMVAVCHGKFLPEFAGAVASVAPLDHVCGSLGAGGGVDGIITETTGTTLALCCPLPEYMVDESRRIGVYHGFLPQSFTLLPWAPAAGMVLKYLRNLMLPGTGYDQVDTAAAAVPPGAEDLMILPHWAGAVSPDVCDHARGAILGVTQAHTAGHYFRAAMEAVAFLMRDNLEALSSFNVNCRELRALGGGAASDLWLQIKADVLNCPVTVPQQRECTACGSAMLGAVAAGLYPDALAIQQAWFRPGKTVEPGKNAAVYQELFCRYREINQTILKWYSSKN